MSSSKYFHEITVHSLLLDEVSSENNISPKLHKINEEAKIFENQTFFIEGEDKIIEEDQNNGLKVFNTKDYTKKG